MGSEYETKEYTLLFNFPLCSSLHSHTKSHRLSNSQSIQMVTALILQLVQCIVVPPSKEDQTTGLPPNRPDTPTGSESGEERGEGQKVQLFHANCRF